ncbi:MAG TPA: tetratricopeptide repeat protein [Pyrinomonadaceae bacterium]|nr:tetratricopeptide repeat protein [Pyrinomonadaceae bacterium]
MFRLILALCLLIALNSYAPLRASAQEEARAAWQVTRFDITASVGQPDRALTARATISARNVGRGAGSTLTLRINSKAEIKQVTVNNAQASFRPSPERQANLQRVTINLPAPVQPEGTVSVSIDYRLPLTENTGLAAISSAGSQFLPLAFWYPTPNTTFSLRGPDTAPFRLSVTGASGETIIASGKASGGTFEQTLNAQPLFLTGSWDNVEGTGDARGATAYLLKGAGADERKQAESLLALAGAARAFYAGLLGQAPDAPVRIVAVTRGGGTSDGGTLLLPAAAFRRPKIDSQTALQIAEAVAKLWIGGATPVRGEGVGVITEGLSRYLANAFLEKQYGAQTADAERLRQRLAYAAVAKRDAPLARTTPLDDTYYTSVANKGAMVWRLAERLMGRDAFLGSLRTFLQKGAEGELTLELLRASLSGRGGPTVKTVLDALLDKPTELDLMVGLPQQRGAQSVAALRNLAEFEVTVPVAATTASGERVTADATIPARSFGEVVFKTSARITRAEIDPEKLYPQLDYSNDIAPRVRAIDEALTEARATLARGENAKAEAAAREVLTVAPSLQEARILLARAMLAAGRADEAEREFRSVMDDPLPSPVALGWATEGLGEVALRKGQSPEAVRRFTEAARVEGEYASTLAARLNRIKAEGSAAPAVEESVKSFVAQLDQAIKTGGKADIDALILPGELPNFSRGIIGTRPELWQTRVLRVEPLDANRVAVDVSLSVRELGRDQSGTAVLILSRAGSAWRLGGIEFLEVR